MIDFAKYAFNKAHATAYAVVAYQTAYLKHYYPVEFMAALMTSVMDNPSKVSEYIYSCRQMGIQILPPDINEGEGSFSVSGTDIRYGLSAIKGLGRPVIDAIVTERDENGKFLNLKDFAKRLTGKEINKRTIESFIKSGAVDSLPGTRRQKMMVYVKVLEDVNREKKDSITGQFSLFDFMGEEEKVEEIQMPDVGEFTMDMLLGFEKEVLGIYVSGHPLQEFESLWKKNITAYSTDFALDEETNCVKVEDGETAIIGGMITAKTVKATRNNSMMAFITLEDLFGNVEVIIFPRDYERYKEHLLEDNKVFIKGKITVEEDKPAKMICGEIIPFDSIPKDVWIKFPTKDEFLLKEEELYELLSESDGKDQVIVYCEAEKAKKVLPRSRTIHANLEIIQKLKGVYGPDNVKIIEKSIEKRGKMD